VGVAVCPEGPALAREVLATSTQISVTITKSRVIVFAIVIALGLTMWWRSQPDPPDVRFLTYVRGNPAARTVSGDSLIRPGPVSRVWSIRRPAGPKAVSGPSSGATCVMEVGPAP
jgi:hypothetical protein